MVSRDDTDSSSAEPTFEPVSGQLPDAAPVTEAPKAPESAEPTEAAPAPRKRATRSRKKAVAPVETPESAESSPELSPEVGASAETAEPVAAAKGKAPARKRSRKKTAAAPAVAEATEPTESTEASVTFDASADEETAVSEEPAEPARVQDSRMSAETEPAIILATLIDPPSLPDLPQDGDDEDEAEDEAPAPVVTPTFGLLFQAPEPAARPPAARRSSRPAAFSAFDDTDDSDGTDDSDDADDRDDSGAPGDANDASDRGGSGDGQDDGDDGSDDRGPRRRRRRGGKGRRRDDVTDTDGTDGSDGSDQAGHSDSDSDSDSDSADGSDNDDDNDSRSGDGSGSASAGRTRRTRSRGSRGRGSASTGSEGDDSSDSGDANDSGEDPDDSAQDDGSDSPTGRRRTRRRRRSGSADTSADDPPGTVTRVREPRQPAQRDVATGIRGSTRLEAKRQRRREGREAGRRRTIITEAEFLARRESVERVMVVRQQGPLTQIGVLEDGVLVEHYISGPGSTSHVAGSSMAGNVYLGRVQNVLPSMEAAFVDIGKGRNAVLYAGEVNWDAAGLEQHKARRIENALSSGQGVLVQVTKDPIGHKGARLTSQVSLPGRYLVYVPDGSMTGISRKLPDTERARLKKILKDIVPENAGVIVRTAAEGASEEELRADVERLTKEWERIQAKAKSGNAPVLLHGEPDLTVRVVRDVFNEDFTKLVVSGEDAWPMISDYVHHVADDLSSRMTKWTGEADVFAHYRIDEQLTKAMDRKVWLPSGGSLVIDRTEAMTVVDVNTGKFTGSGGNLEETVTKNNIEAAEEIVRQLRLRDIGGIIVIDFIDMVLESNRDLVVRRLLECLGRDRTKHQVAEVTSLGLVQMTRKRVGAGLIEVFSEPCEHCAGRGLVVHAEPVDRSHTSDGSGSGGGGSRGGDSREGRGHSRRGRGRDSGGSGTGSSNGNGSGSGNGAGNGSSHGNDAASAPSGPTPAQIAAAAYAAAVNAGSQGQSADGEDSAERAAQVAADIEIAVERAQAAPSDASRAAGSADTDAQAGPDAVAVVEAVTRVLDARPAAAPDASDSTTSDSTTSDSSASTASATSLVPETPAAARARRRGSRRAVRTAATAPASSAGAGVFVAPQAGGNAEVAQALEAEPSAPSTSDAGDSGDALDPGAREPSTPPAPTRRKRARVVAPAGPPTGADGESAG